MALTKAPVICVVIYFQFKKKHIFKYLYKAFLLFIYMYHSLVFQIHVKSYRNLLGFMISKNLTNCEKIAFINNCCVFVSKGGIQQDLWNVFHMV